MNYRIVLEFSINNDETEQTPPSRAEVIDLIYNDGRFAPLDTLTNITHLEVDAF